MSLGSSSSEWAAVRQKADALITHGHHNDARPLALIVARNASDTKTRLVWAMKYAACLYHTKQYFAALDVIEVLFFSAPSPKQFMEPRRHPDLPSVSPDDAFAHVSQCDAISLAMRCAEELKNWKKMQWYATKLLAIEPNAGAYCALALFAQKTNASTAAVRGYYERALSVDSTCATAVTAMAQLHLMPPAELRTIIAQLEFPSEEFEVLRQMYYSLVPPDTTAADGLGASSLISGASPIQPSGLPPSPVPAAQRVTEQRQALVPRAAALYAEASQLYNDSHLEHACVKCKELLDAYPHDDAATLLYLAVLVALKKVPELYKISHTLAERRSSKSGMVLVMSYYAIGCYYYALGNYERAGRLFCKATESDPVVPPAWIAYGHCYAKLEEGEQALSAYRRSQNLFPGLASCAVFIGVQHCRAHNWSLASVFLDGARRIAPTDPLVLNELSVIQFRNRAYPKALSLLQAAVSALPSREAPHAADCVYFNIATVLRKLKDYGQAVEYYLKYLSLHPNAAHAHCAVGFTEHLRGNLREAIRFYHSALSLKPSDVFCRELLEKALEAEYSSMQFLQTQGINGPSMEPSMSTAPSSTQFPHYSIHSLSPPVQGRYSSMQPVQLFGSSSEPSDGRPSATPNTATQRRLQF